MFKKVIFLITGSILLLSSQLQAEKRLWADSFLGKKAPELSVEGWISEKPEIKEDQFVLIDFWGTYCPPCLKAIPELNEYQKEFGEKLVVIGISHEPKEKIEALKDPKIEYFSAFDTEKKMKNTLGVRGIPHVILINPAGIVVWEGFPFLPDHELTADVIRKLLVENN